MRTVPGVRKAVEWNSPFYGIEGEGWSLSFHCFMKYVKVAFFRGTSRRPLPPAASKHKEVRCLDIHQDDQLHEAQLAACVKQASQLPGTKVGGLPASVPSSVPVIRPSAGGRGIIFAFGHGRLGPTLAPATARKIEALPSEPARP